MKFEQRQRSHNRKARPFSTSSADQLPERFPVWSFVTGLANFEAGRPSMQKDLKTEKAVLQPWLSSAWTRFLAAADLALALEALLAWRAKCQISATPFKGNKHYQRAMFDHRFQAWLNSIPRDTPSG